MVVGRGIVNTSMNEYLRRTAATLEGLHGWDFSRMQTDIDPVPWEYTEVVREYLHLTSRVLDIGTGGGEKFLVLAPHFGTGVGTDVSPAMIHTARANTPPKLAATVTFMVMAAEALAFPDASFDVVLNRHAPFAVDQVLRVLRHGGVFITQQVGDNNSQNVFEALGWPSNRAWWEHHHPAHSEPTPHTMDEL
ncbi:MAG: class I SAM-dependent methyltransferase, partial [Dehalococcoidia bacterium]